MNCLSIPTKAAMLLLPLLLISCGGDGFRIHVTFSQTNELKKGSQVRFRGIPVGEVQQVVLRRAPDGKATEAIAALVIRDKQVVLRESDTFRLATAGLIGESFIDILPGPSGSLPLRPDATVEGMAPPEFSLTDTKNRSTVLGLLELTTRMGKLPPEKRDAIMKEFHAIVERAIQEQVQPAGNLPTSDKMR